MPIKFVILWTDALIYLLIISAVIFLLWIGRKGHLARAWQRILSNKLAMVSIIVLCPYLIIGFLDSIHFQRKLPINSGQGIYYSAHTESAFDALVAPLGRQYEKTYSAPFALNSFVVETYEYGEGIYKEIYPRLQYAGQGIETLDQRNLDIFSRILIGTIWGLLTAGGLIALLVWLLGWHLKIKFHNLVYQIVFNKTEHPWRIFFITLLIVTIIACISFNLSSAYHVFGTDKIGQDVFYQTLKSIRTGLVIGTLTTLVMLPFATMLGITAGYFLGWIDDIIQYVYTTLSSIPGVLLIAAAILSLQIFIENHPNLFPSLEAQDDARLLALCVILGITSWTSLCRLLRAETLKIREIDYIQAAIAIGTSHGRIIMRHILPNVLHIILITIILDFSILVLAEAVLSYIGVGVAPGTMSWGNMINSARLELAREPIVWWPILAAFMFMFTLVLSANMLADVIRDALDPRLV